MTAFISNVNVLGFNKLLRVRLQLQSEEEEEEKEEDKESPHHCSGDEDVCLSLKKNETSLTKFLW